MAPPRRNRRKKSGGLGRVAAAAAKQKGGRKWLKLGDGDVVVLRLLDTGEDFTDAFVHRVQMEKEDGESMYVDVPCLDQDEKGLPCPGCKKDLDRRYKFWANVIVRDWEDDETAGKPKDTLMIWAGGITIAKRLDKMAARHDLALRDIEVSREGSKMKDTKYEVEWADEENVPLSDEDEELAKGKFDVTRYSKPPSFDDFFVPPGERDKDDDDDEDAGAKSLRRGSAFSKKRTDSSTSRKPGGLGAMKAKKSDNGDDESPRKTTVRRRRTR